MRLIEFEREADLDYAIEAEIRRVWQINRFESAGIMLTGGSSPLNVYAALAQQPPAPLNASIRIVLSDERCVPPDSDQNNLRHLQGVLDAAGLPRDRVIAVDSALPPQQALCLYGTRLDEFFERGGVLSFALLGLGADGHVAGLFTDEHAASAATALLVERADGLSGISAGASVLRRAQNVIFMIKGKEKQAAVQSLLHAPYETIAGKVFANHPSVRLCYWQGC